MGCEVGSGQGHSAGPAEAVKQHALVYIGACRRSDWSRVAPGMRAMGSCRCGRTYHGRTKGDVRELHRVHLDEIAQIARRFDPDWVIAPGETLREWMEENHLHPRAAALTCGRMPLELFEGILAGEVAITPNVAEGLARTGIPARLWLNLERAYRLGLAAGKKRT